MKTYTKVSLARLNKALFKKNRKDWQVVIVCMFLASCIWLLQELGKDYRTTILYPVVFKYNDTVYLPTKPLPQYVSLDVVTNGYNLVRQSQLFSRKPIVINLNASFISVMIDSIDVFGQARKFLPHVKIVGLLPDKQVFSFDSIASRKLTLKVDPEKLQLKAGFYLVSPIHVAPSTVIATGPKQKIDSLPSVLTIQIPDRNLAEDFEEIVALNFKKIDGVLFDRQEAVVGFKVDRMLVGYTVLKASKVGEKAPTDTNVDAKDALKVQYLYPAAFKTPYPIDSFRVGIASVKALPNSDTLICYKLLSRPITAIQIQLVNKCVHVKRRKT